MTARGRRCWVARATAALTVLLPLIGGVAVAAGPAALVSAQCRTTVHDALARAPAMRDNDVRIARLLDAKQYRRAAAALRSTADHGSDPWAGEALGNLYAAGLGVPRSADSAFKWYLWSAERGNQTAQRQVANDYLQGEGTRRNAAQAAYWFRIGVAPYQLAHEYYDLSQIYTRGHLAPVDPRKSDYYLDKAIAVWRALAKEPNGEANYYLGLAYQYGHGVRKDPAKSVAYLCRAASLDYGPAMTAISRLLGAPQ